MAELNVIKNINAERLDVTKQDLIHVAVALVKKQDNGLYALVSNAGIGGGPMPPAPIEEQTSFRME
jgi:NAD(P)-dependent dehydrogenase (short-subunit alcohol dehydrogenase family)